MHYTVYFLVSAMSFHGSCWSVASHERFTRRKASCGFVWDVLHGAKNANTFDSPMRALNVSRRIALHRSDLKSKRITNPKPLLQFSVIIGNNCWITSLIKTDIFSDLTWNFSRSIACFWKTRALCCCSATNPGLHIRNRHSSTEASKNPQL